MTELLLGIDIGTASTKGVLVSPDGTVVARASREHAVSFPQPGWVEHDPERVWWTGFVTVARELLAGRCDALAAVGVSGIGACLLPCDANDRPLRAAILYGVDTRSEQEVSELTARFGQDAIIERSGSALSSQTLGPKLLWVRRNEPDVWTRTRRWHMASSFVVSRLTGSWVLDRHSASQCDPLYDLAAEGWYTPWVEQIVGDLPMPELAWPAEIVGEVGSAGAEATGITPGTPVVAGTIDAWAEAVSIGVRRPHELMLMYGSTMFLIALVDKRRHEPSLWLTHGVDPGSLTIAAGMATSGSLTAWLRALCGSPPFEQLVAEAAAVPAGADSLLVLPYFQGERTPILDPRARGTITGLTLRHERGHLYRAALEGVALGVRHNLDVMALAREPERAVAVGGGTAGRLWTQIVTDACDLPQEVPTETIGASLGDARLAAEGAGLVPAGGFWKQPCERIEPEPAAREVYDELYKLYRELYPASRRVQHALAARQLAEPGQPGASTERATPPDAGPETGPRRGSSRGR